MTSQMASETFEQIVARLPQALEAEFVMTAANEPIRIAVDNIHIHRSGTAIGTLVGEVAVHWTPTLKIVCYGDCDAHVTSLVGDTSVQLHVPAMGLTTEASVVSVQMGERHAVRAHLRAAVNLIAEPARSFRFYLTNFPDYIGLPIKRGSGQFPELCRDRLSMNAGHVSCVVDRISHRTDSHSDTGQPGYLITHVGEVRSNAANLSVEEMRELLDALYWFFAFIRGARTGPILPSTHSPYRQTWIMLAPWVINEPRDVDTWMPDRSPIDVDTLFSAFLSRWKDPVWNEGLRTTLAWHLTANASNTPNEARVLLCQIALEVLASLNGSSGKHAHDRIRTLFNHLHVPTAVPEHLVELRAFAEAQSVDGPECLTRIRNKLEHPTADNRRKARDIDGLLRLQAGQYAIESFELCTLALMNYRGKYARRAFRGWKGDDEVTVPWA